LGAVVTSKLLNDGWLVRGPKWPKPGQNVEERIEELHGG
jgi:hypothetical protein